MDKSPICGFVLGFDVDESWEGPTLNDGFCICSGAILPGLWNGVVSGCHQDGVVVLTDGRRVVCGGRAVDVVGVADDVVSVVDTDCEGTFDVSDWLVGGFHLKIKQTFVYVCFYLKA